MKMTEFWFKLKFAPKGPSDNKPALVQVMAWCRNRRQTIIWTTDDLVYWRIYVALGGDESMQKRHNSIANALELCLFCIKPFT